MFLELRSLFQVDNDIHVVSYSQDGDPDNYPVMYCGSASGQDLTDKGDEAIFAAGEAISDRWNDSLGQATVAFLQVNYQVEFKRDTFAKDVEKQLEQFIRQELVPLEDKETQQWAASFVAYLGTLEGIDNHPPRDAKPSRNRTGRLRAAFLHQGRGRREGAGDTDENSTRSKRSGKMTPRGAESAAGSWMSFHHTPSKSCDRAQSVARSWAMDNEGFPTSEACAPMASTNWMVGAWEAISLMS